MKASFAFHKLSKCLSTDALISQDILKALGSIYEHSASDLNYCKAELALKSPAHAQHKEILSALRIQNLDILEVFDNFPTVAIKKHYPLFLKNHNLSQDLESLPDTFSKKQWLKRYTHILETMPYHGSYQTNMTAFYKNLPMDYQPSQYSLAQFVGRERQDSIQEKIKVLNETILSLHIGAGWEYSDINNFLKPITPYIKKHLSNHDPKNADKSYSALDCFYLECVPRLQQKNILPFLNSPGLCYEKVLLQNTLSIKHQETVKPLLKI